MTLLKESPHLAPWRPAAGIAPQLTDAGLTALAMMQAMLRDPGQWEAVARAAHRGLPPKCDAHVGASPLPRTPRGRRRPVVSRPWRGARPRRRGPRRSRGRTGRACRPRRRRAGHEALHLLGQRRAPPLSQLLDSLQAWTERGKASQSFDQKDTAAGVERTICAYPDTATTAGPDASCQTRTTVPADLVDTSLTAKDRR